MPDPRAIGSSSTSQAAASRRVYDPGYSGGGNGGHDDDDDDDNDRHASRRGDIALRPLRHSDQAASQGRQHDQQRMADDNRQPPAWSSRPGPSVWRKRPSFGRSHRQRQSSIDVPHTVVGGHVGRYDDHDDAEEGGGTERRGLLADQHHGCLDDGAPLRSGTSHVGTHSRRGSSAGQNAHAGPPWWNLGRRRRAADSQGRTVRVLEAQRSKSSYPPNVVRNQKYNVATFLPIVLYEQFKYFYNLYFLLVALSQFIPQLKIGFIATYIAPLAFVLLITISKEAIDDYARYKRDVESNGTPYEVLLPDENAGQQNRRYRDADVEGAGQPQPRYILRPSSKLHVGDLVLLHKNQRVPADMVLLKTTAGDHSSLPPQGSGVGTGHVIDAQSQFVLGEDEDGAGDQAEAPPLQQRDVSHKHAVDGGTCFIRTDQLDGETDWKLRVAVDATQRMSDQQLVALEHRASVFAGPPIKDIHTFVGNLTIPPGGHITPDSQSGADNTPMIGDLLGSSDGDMAEGMSSGTTMALHRQMLVAPLTAENLLWANTVLAAGSAIGIVVYTGRETRAVMNTSHPSTKMGILDLEVNKLSKILCGVTFALSVGLVALNGFRGQWYIYIFRFLILFSSIIPISLRVNLDMGKTVYARQIMHDSEIPGTLVRTSTLPEELGRIEYLLSDKTGTLTQNEMELKKLHLGTMSYSWDSMDEVSRQLASALDVQKGQADGAAGAGASLMSPAKTIAASAMFSARSRRDMTSRVKDVVLALALCHNVTPVDNDDGTVTYQASSPDEVAIVRWTQSIGLTLVARTRTCITLKALYDDSLMLFDILEIFPFSSESKRMGIVVRDRQTREVTFYQKGADVVMAKIVAQNDWLDEECGNMARDGLRTLVVGQKRLTEERWQSFDHDYHEARISVDKRNEAMASTVSDYLEHDLELLGLTGVEDKLQDDVKTTLELLRNAGVKIWMLTGDKIETATCIAISSKLVARNQYIHQVSKLQTREQVRDMLDFLSSKLDCCLVIDGESLQKSLDYFSAEFFSLATQLSSVVACRCSPTQKAEVARYIQHYTRKRVCCIGDGGNDVSMIQAANVGLGIQGKEGMQASLAADFSLAQFSHVTKLIVWHGRNSYQRSAKLAQFVIHRGLIISIIQAVFSSIFYFAPIALYQGWLMVGYATVYTSAPAFSLTLDRDVSEDVALLYPELFKGIGRSLTAKTFTEWLIISVYQGGAIMLVSLYVFERELINILSISFTALVVNELIMIALEVTTWHPYMVMAELASLLLYCISMAFLPEFFDLNFVFTNTFLWKTAIIVAVSSLPLYIIKFVRQRLNPPAYTKLNMS